MSSLPQNLFYTMVYRHFVVWLSWDFVVFSAFTGELYVRAYWLCPRQITLRTYLLLCFPLQHETLE
jgi:hypothetical protein